MVLGIALIGRLTSLTAGDPLVVLLLCMVAAWFYMFVRRARLLFRTRLRRFSIKSHPWVISGFCNIWAGAQSVGLVRAGYLYKNSTRDRVQIVSRTREQPEKLRAPT